MEVSGELIHSIATGLLFLLGAWWTVYFVNRWQRAQLWADGVHAWGDRVHGAGPGWTGALASGTVRITSDIWGVRTRLVRKDGTRLVVEGVLLPEEAEARLNQTEV